jgi:hypothetical protein
MHSKAIGFAVTALLGAAIFGQTATQTMQDRLFHLTHTTTVQEFQEIANGVRTIADIRDMSTDNAQMSLTVRGTAEQIGLAEWLVAQLDQPAGAAIVPASPEYKGLSGTDEKGLPANDEIAAVMYLPHTATVQDFQEAVNATRTITEIRRMFTYNDGRAVMARGTPAQIAMAEWLAHDLDQATAPRTSSQPSQSSGAHEYSIGKDDTMRVFYVANATTVQDLQEIANTARTIAEIRRIFTYNTPRAIAIRGTPDDLAIAEWLFGQLEKPLGSQSEFSGEYRLPGTADDVVRVFHLAHVMTGGELVQEATQIRTALEIRRVFVYTSQRAVAVRGTVSQLALAENMVRELDQPGGAAKK